MFHLNDLALWLSLALLLAWTLQALPQEPARRTDVDDPTRLPTP